MLDTKEKILDVWNNLGFTDTVSFEKYYKGKIASGISSEEELNLLSPKNVDLQLFWELCDKHFRGSICGALMVDKELEQNIQTINYMNWKLAVQMNSFDNFRQMLPVYQARGKPLRILEIGPGYGCLQYELDREGLSTYYSIDVCPRIDGCLSFDGWSFPQTIMDNDDIMCVISSNVFQHISVEQRKKFYTQISQLLKRNEDNLGYFNFNIMTLACDRPDTKFVYFNDKYYICHMGMYTQIQDPKQIQQDLNNAGLNIITTTYRTDGMAGFSCYANGRKSV